MLRSDQLPSRTGFVRSIGKWGFAGLAINSIIGSAIFGVPGELNRLLGPASPIILIVAAVAMAVIMACYVEVASQFTEPGGSYLYVRSAFGPFPGLLIGWFAVLAPLGAAAAQVNLFASYFALLMPVAASVWGRSLIIIAVVAAMVTANYRGVSNGNKLSGLLAVVKLAPLLLLIVIGVAHFGSHSLAAPFAALAAAPPMHLWATAFVLAAFCFGGFEDPLVPQAEIKDSGRTIFFGFAVTLVVCTGLYALLQVITVEALAGHATDRPLAATAEQLIGSRASVVTALAAMISVIGATSSIVLSVPRLLFSLARHGEFPAFLGRLHRKYQTPDAAVVTVGGLILAMALTGTYMWALAVCAGAMMIVYGAVCGALIRLRRMQPHAHAIRIPGGPILAALGICISAYLLVNLDISQIALMGLTVGFAGINWVWSARSRRVPERAKDVVVP